MNMAIFVNYYFKIINFSLLGSHLTRTVRANVSLIVPPLNVTPSCFKVKNLTYFLSPNLLTEISCLHDQVH